MPSISADPKYKGEVAQTAEKVVEFLNQAGAEKVTLYATAGHPIVYGEKIISDRVPTVLVYGHYDVQPPDPLDLWQSPPFEPTV